MSIFDLNWSSNEKKVAKKAFDNAYQREMEEIKSSFLEKAAKINNSTDLWAIEDFLNQKRKVVDKKYDYRYSQLIVVFSRLMREGYLFEKDIKDLDDEKKELIKKLTSE